MTGTFVSMLYTVANKLRARLIRTRLDHVNKQRFVINIVTTWKINCGIATYSSFLINHFKKAQIRLVPISKPHSSNPVFFLVSGLKAGREGGIVHIQFEYGIFGRLKLFGHSITGWGVIPFFLSLLLFGKAWVVTTLHEISPDAYEKFLWKKFLTKFVWGLSDAVIVHNQRSKEFLSSYHGINRKIHVVPMGTYEKPMFLDKDACKEQLGLSGKRVITILGYVNREKGHDMLIDILPSLNPDICLLIAGGPRLKHDELYYKELQTKVHQLGMEQRVTFYGFVPEHELSLVLNASDIAVLPYRSVTESGILRILISYRLPTLTSDVESFREINKKYDCTELFRKNDEADLLKKILFLLDSDKRVAQLTTNCEKVFKETRWSVVAEKHEDLYLEVLVHASDETYREKRHQERMEWLKRNIIGNALEVGCGTGFVMRYCNVDVGLDIDRLRVFFAKKRLPLKEFIIASALYLPLRDQTFDTVMLPEILEHLPYYQAMKVHNECTRIARRTLLITVPNANKTDYDKSLVENPEHKWFPTINLVKNMVGDKMKMDFTSQRDFFLIKLSLTKEDV